MKTTQPFLCSWMSLLLTGLITLAMLPQASGQEKYKPNWKSLSKWEVPAWFEKSVLGIYMHWGVYSVPGYRFNDDEEQVDSGLWYGGAMYIPNDAEQRNFGTYDFHKENYGDPCEFGYEQFVPLFTAEKWDPDAWITLFKEAGADYAGIAAEHGDGFVLWDSEYDKFNAMDKGPKRDILGDLFEAARKQGLKTVATFHEPPAEMFDEGRKRCPEDASINDPQYADLYETSSFDVLNKKLYEVIDKYRPDQLWFEDKYNGEKNWKPFIAYYFNEAEKWGKEVFIAQKHGEAPLSCSILDLEGGSFPGGKWEWVGMTEPQPQRWQKDVPIGNYWAYAEGVGCRPVNMLVDGIVDRISKNGVSLLNVAPKADGTLPEAQVKCLQELGAWMKINREALYAAKPAPYVKGGTDEWRAGSIRFTEKDEFLYAIELGNEWPSTVGFAGYGDSQVPEVPFTIAGVQPVEGSEVYLLGHEQPLPWHMEGDDLVIETLPELQAEQHAWSFKVQVR